MTEPKRRCPACGKRVVDVGAGVEVTLRVLTRDEWPRAGMIAIACPGCGARVELGLDRPIAQVA